MLAHWGETFYWTATLVAGLIAALAVVGYFSDVSAGEPVVPIAAFMLAGLIWLIGWACRSIFARS